MPKVIHFEIFADDAERAARFYKAVCGWEIQRWDGPVDYWLVNAGPDEETGINGAIGERGEGNETTVNVISVPSLDEALAQVEANGGKVTSPKNLVPGVGTMVYCKDSEGNTIGLMELLPAEG